MPGKETTTSSGFFAEPLGGDRTIMGKDDSHNQWWEYAEIQPFPHCLMLDISKFDAEITFFVGKKTCCSWSNCHLCVCVCVCVQSCEFQTSGKTRFWCSNMDTKTITIKNISWILDAWRCHFRPNVASDIPSLATPSSGRLTQGPATAGGERTWGWEFDKRMLRVCQQSPVKSYTYLIHGNNYQWNPINNHVSLLFTWFFVPQCGKDKDQNTYLHTYFYRLGLGIELLKKSGRFFFKSLLGSPPACVRPSVSIWFLSHPGLSQEMEPQSRVLNFPYWVNFPY